MASRYRWLLLSACCLVVRPDPGVARTTPAGPDGAGAFLSQMRCAAPGQLPGDAGCGGLLPLDENEDPGYRLSNGGSGRALIDGLNVLDTRNGVQRAVSVDAHVAETDPARRGGASVEAVGTSYLSLLGSWSPVATSVYLRADATGAKNGTGKNGTDPLLDAWVLGPAGTVAAEQGHGSTVIRQVVGAVDAAGPGRASAFTWEHRSFPYRWGRSFESLVSVHYSSSDAAGRPGPAQQRERIYLAYGLGLARWEKWSRADWNDPRDGRTAWDEARAVFDGHRCSRPIDDAAQGDGVSYGPVLQTGDAYSEVITAAPGQPAHVWLLTLCEDYTDLVPGPTRDLLPWVQAADDALWR